MPENQPESPLNGESGSQPITPVPGAVTPPGVQPLASPPLESGDNAAYKLPVRGVPAPRPPSNRSFWIFITVFFVVGLGVAALVLFGLRSNGGQLSQALKLKNQSLDSQVLSGLSPQAPASGSYAVGGDLSVTGIQQASGLVLIPSASPVSPKKGQIYFDQATHQLNYFDGSSFVNLLGGSDNITQLVQIGPGLAYSSGHILNTGVVTLQAGNGIAVNGATITNTGVTNLTSPDNSIGITKNASGTYQLTVQGTGSGSVTSLNGLTGALTVANSSGSGSTVTIDDASTTAKGIAQFDSTNFSVSGGLVNTIQGIAVSSSPTFAGLTLSSALTVGNGGTGSTTAAGALTNLGAAASGNNSDILTLDQVTSVRSTSGLTVGWGSAPLALTGDGSTYLSASVGGFTNTLNFETPTSGNTISIPDETGDICLQSSPNCGFAPDSGSGNYIQNQNASDQTADFRISGSGRANTSLITPLLTTTTGDLSINAVGNTVLQPSGGRVGIGIGSPNATLEVNGASWFDSTIVSRVTSGDAITLNNDSSGAVNIVLGGTNGTKIGTDTNQKLAFYNATPIIQPASTTDLRQAIINLGLLASGGSTPLDLNGGALTAAAATLSNASSLTLGQASTNTGSIVFKGSGNANAITLSGPASPSNNTITLPDETGTICLQSSTNCGFATTSSNAFIQNGTTVQTSANFAIQSAAAGSIGGVIRGASGQTADLLEAQNSSGIVLGSIDANGNLLLAAKAGPQYKGGADNGASVRGRYVAVSGHYAYAVGGATGTCSAASPAGCELRDYDVSNPASPVYIGGANQNGTTNGGSTHTAEFQNIFISGRYAYVVQQGDATACSATAGSAQGCELKIFDISNPKSPTYVGGMDASGTQTGTDTGAFAAFNQVFVSGRYAYVVKTLSSTTCAGAGTTDAVGCELQVYDVSNPTAPVYVGGADTNGSANSGGSFSSFNAIYVSGRYAYIAQTGDSTSCKNTVGSAQGCELKIFDITNPAAPLYTGGADTSGSTGTSGGAGTASTTALSLYVQGNLVYLTTAGDATTCSATAGSAAGCEFKVFNVSDPTAPVYKGGADVSGQTNASSSSTSADIGNVFVAGRYAYLTKTVADATTCTSSTSGNGAAGCEFQVYDVGTPTAPTYLGGADDTGTTNSGTGANGNGGFHNAFVSGRYAYLSQEYSTSTCNATPGSAIGCEMQIYDVTGADLTSANISSLDSGNLTVEQDATVNNQLTVNGGLTVGTDGIQSAGPVSINMPTGSGATPALKLQGINSVATVGSELLTGDCSGTGFTGTGSGPYTHSVAASGNTTLTCTITGGVVAGATYQIKYDVSSTQGNAEVITPSIGGVSSIKSTGSPTGFTAVITTTNTSNPTLVTNSPLATGTTISNISFKLVTTTNNLLAVNNSDATGGIEVRSGGSGLGNSFIGLLSGLANTAGNFNSAFGAGTLQGNLTGSSNAVLGYQAAQSGSSASSNVVVGYQAFQLGNSSSNVVVGYQALQNDIMGGSNVAVGYQALQNDRYGSANIAIGYQALQSNTTATGLLAIGYQAGKNLVGGANTIAIGTSALLNGSQPIANTAIGVSALSANTNGTNNTGIGYFALGSINGSFVGGNTGIGYQAGYQDPTVSTFVTTAGGTNMTMIGYGAQGQANNSLILGGQGANAVNVGIGTTSPTNTLSVSPDQYDTGTAGTGGVSSTTITGSGTTWTANMVGSEFIFADGTKRTITAFGSATSLTVASAVTEAAGKSYRIHRPAFQVTSAGKIGVNAIAPSGDLEVHQLADGDDALVIKRFTDSSPTGNFLRLQDATGADLVSISITGNLTVKAVTVNGTLTVNGHVISGNSSGTTTVAVTGGAGVGATVSVSGNDTSGTITLNTGTGAISGSVMQLTFANAYSGAPHIVFSPSSNWAGATFYYDATATNTSVVTISAGSVASSATYRIDYHIFQ